MGSNVSTLWKNVLNSSSSISQIDDPSFSQIPSRIAGQIKDFDPKDILSSREIRQYDPFVHYGVVAADEAVRDADLYDHDLDPNRIGVAVTSGMGGLSFLDHNIVTARNRGSRRVSPYFIPGTLINMLPGAISLKYNFKGPSFSVVSACSSASHAMAVAHRHLLHGDADIILVGGSEHACNFIGMSAFSALRALSKRNDAPQQASRPWDRDRDGFVMADGAAVLVMERESHARKRGAKIHAVFAGAGMSSDAFHFVQPDVSGDGAKRAIEGALKDASISLSDVDYVNAHATSTSIGDPIEPKALWAIDAEATKKLAISSTKSMHGHLLGAAGGIEAILSIKALQDSIVPPTINCDNPELDLDVNLVQHHPQDKKIRYALSNSFGFGGTNVSVLFRGLNEN